MLPPAPRPPRAPPRLPPAGRAGGGRTRLLDRRAPLCLGVLAQAGELCGALFVGLTADTFDLRGEARFGARLHQRHMRFVYLRIDPGAVVRQCIEVDQNRPVVGRWRCCRGFCRGAGRRFAFRFVRDLLGTDGRTCGLYGCWIGRLNADCGCSSLGPLFRHTRERGGYRRRERFGLTRPWPHGECGNGDRCARQPRRCVRQPRRTRAPARTCSGAGLRRSFRSVAMAGRSRRALRSGTERRFAQPGAPATPANAAR